VTGDPLDYLLGLEAFGIKFGLENIRTLSRALGDPHQAFPSVIIGGTNGKGSVAAMVDASLRAAGVRTGRYTSPHLVRLEERFAIDGCPVATDTLRSAAARVRDAIDGLRAAGTLAVHPTFFEATTAAAFDIFRSAAVELAVLEVGLGGRYDATNIVTPVAAAITTIDLDHERYLGSTIAEIAFEKAGIIKSGIPVVVGEAKPEAVAVIARAARARGSRYIAVPDEVVPDVDAELHDGRARVRFETPKRLYPAVTLGLRGRHQVANAATAVRLLEVLEDQGWPVGPRAIERGLQEAQWRGRLDLISAPHGRTVLLDGAHNPAGAASLARYLAEVHPAGLPMVFGALRDKDTGRMLRLLDPHVTRFVFTRPLVRRGTAPADLLAQLRATGSKRDALAVEEPGSALEAAWATAPEIAAAGSLYLAGEILKILDAQS
jgi:dihydrofolate synthase/folylpolyglutamate synthase